MSMLCDREVLGMGQVRMLDSRVDSHHPRSGHCYRLQVEVEEVHSGLDPSCRSRKVVGRSPSGLLGLDPLVHSVELVRFHHCLLMVLIDLGPVVLCRLVQSLSL